MTPTNLIATAFNAFYRQHQFPKPDPASCENSMAGLDPAAANLGHGEIIFCQLSPLHRITLDDETKVAASIPRNASHFAWAYPAVDDGSGGPRRNSSEAAFLQFGGYVYFDTQGNALGTNSICPAAYGTLGLMFGRPHLLEKEVTDLLTQKGRFQEITLDSLASKGATHFAWIRPGEFNGKVFCPDGAFAYKFADALPKYFSVVAKPVFTQELLEEELDATEAWVVVRGASPEPYLETVMIFDKTKSLRENLDFTIASDTSNNFVVAAGMTSAYVTKDSNPNDEMTYEVWKSSQDSGTVADPWIINMMNERLALVGM
jgi:hypothetical protein